MTDQQIIRSQITLISPMDKQELLEYQSKLSLSQLSDKAKSFLYRAVDIALAEYSAGQHDSIAVSSSISID